jgi:hypothetical protein
MNLKGGGCGCEEFRHCGKSTEEGGEMRDEREERRGDVKYIQRNRVVKMRHQKNGDIKEISTGSERKGETETETEGEVTTKQQMYDGMGRHKSRERVAWDMGRQDEGMVKYREGSQKTTGRAAQHWS